MRLARGVVILAYSRTFIDKACMKAVRRKLKGRDVLVVNSSHWVSEIGGRLAKSADAALVWYYDHGRGCYCCSLRSAHDDVDVSVIAKEFGGGGHRLASGFQTPVNNIEEIFDTDLVEAEGEELEDTFAQLADKQPSKAG
jgi:oligoribonuclease NrnB/cAMP/cGMP phosphodiesterase (DHH superfamily)